MNPHAKKSLGLRSVDLAKHVIGPLLPIRKSIIKKIPNIIVVMCWSIVLLEYGFFWHLKHYGFFNMHKQILVLLRFVPQKWPNGCIVHQSHPNIYFWGVFFAHYWSPDLTTLDFFAWWCIKKFEYQVRIESSRERRRWNLWWTHRTLLITIPISIKFYKMFA